MKLRQIMGVVLFFAATASTGFAALITYPYPYVYKDPVPQTRLLTWTAPGGSSISAALPGFDIRCGQLISSQVIAGIPYIINATALRTNFNTSNPMIAVEHDDFTLTDPVLKINSNAKTQCLGYNLWSPFGATQTFKNVVSATSIGSWRGNAAFDVNNPKTFDKSGYGASTATLSVKGSIQNINGTFTKYSVNADPAMPNRETAIRVARSVIPWKLHEVLAKEIQPRVITYKKTDTINSQGIVADPKPNFGFTPQETAHLGQFDHFNWYQEVYEFKSGASLSDPNAGKVLTGSALTKWAGRGLGVDPALGGQFGDVFDKYPLTYNEFPVKGSLPGSNWSDSGNRDGLSWGDLPNLTHVGDEIFLESALAGVRQDHKFKLIADIPGVPNVDDFVLRWHYIQTGLGTGIVGFDGFGEGSLKWLDLNSKFTSDQIPLTELNSYWNPPLAAGPTAMLATPVPEPGSAPVLVGLGVAMVWRRRGCRRS